MFDYQSRNLIFKKKKSFVNLCVYVIRKCIVLVKSLGVRYICTGDLSRYKFCVLPVFLHYVTVHLFKIHHYVYNMLYYYVFTLSYTECVKNTFSKKHYRWNQGQSNNYYDCSFTHRRSQYLWRGFFARIKFFAKTVGGNKVHARKNFLRSTVDVCAGYIHTNFA